MKVVSYYCEGETEMSLVSSLKGKKNIAPGRVKKFNLWQDQISKIERTFKEGGVLIFIIDTDAMNPSNIFIDNIKKLKKWNFCLRIQNKNLEYELCFSCGKSGKPALYKDFYDCNSVSEFKNKLNKDNNLYRTLERNQFDFKKLWTRSSHFKSHFHSCLPKIDSYICDN